MRNYTGNISFKIFLTEWKSINCINKSIFSSCNFQNHFIAVSMREISETIVHKIIQSGMDVGQTISTIKISSGARASKQSSLYTIKCTVDELWQAEANSEQWKNEWTSCSVRQQRSGTLTSHHTRVNGQCEKFQASLTHRPFDRSDIIDWDAGPFEVFYRKIERAEFHAR